MLESKHQVSMDQHRTVLNESLQDLRQQKVSVSNISSSAVQESISRERRDREASHAFISEQVQELERRFKDMLSRVTATHDSSQASFSNSLNGLERHLREELRGMHDEHHSKTVDLKEYFQRVVNDKHLEAQEVI